ncbi:superoxide dismutase family protein [Bacillus sp. T33-2]|uniref:superoxide dismutase family protein n=1 Tax=Bacillus sp. T33-2 TaxID=2054168 RepID=UPI000C76743F|nr:superoxide dismutase family protein [Bacillus sp. T33-2]PLR95028.1 hypothetical protein CVD19_15305 [Bacillus sp. T33-2]
MNNNSVKPLSAMFAVMLLTGCAASDGPQGAKTTQENIAFAESGSGQKKGQRAKAEMKDVNGNKVGTVSFSEHGTHLFVEANLKGLTPGHHGFHIHEKGICEPDAQAGPFTTAGGHFNPAGATHSGHAGDMPSIYVNEDGKAKISFSFDRLIMDHLKEQELAVMIHEKPDNFGNIPDRYQAAGQAGPDQETMKTGDAGKRQACGVITVKAKKDSRK